ncbi:alpha-amylase family glycosyl hydrolase [Amantichitinum ursilacus]|uniref:Oligo-1,6-glucosidase 1 n=1 Tax=Amantichitinum ursilacus TaxID=857265 RepID=A0A0N0GP05_9NEIS|nr:alpha-amylase family glycosyl hydrolase [Amantichitinum ursilacus]KPC53063.1 Oligo-1,6-glucosidase 1 [Amantichitinum ursilacus]
MPSPQPEAPGADSPRAIDVSVSGSAGRVPQPQESASEWRWWQRGVIYEVYPRSFQDSNGDGVGDLRGIRQRLPYLAWLGVDIVWIPPVYPSPMADFGYDVIDPTAIDPLFGTLEDMDALIADAHQLGLKVIIDFVPNHTSDQCPWFIESRSGRDNPKRDWYIWHDPAPDGGPPTNWFSHLGGRAWTLDKASGQYYMHSFLPEQPDLNWRNNEVQEAVLQQLRFWLDRGVDGFRMDALMHLFKDANFHNNPPNPDYDPKVHGEHEQLMPRFTLDQAEVQVVIARMRALLDQYDGDRMMLGELYLPLEALIAYYGADGKGVQLPTNSLLILQPWKIDSIRTAILEVERLVPQFAWPNWSFGNHDKQRLATRLGQDQVRLAAMLLLTLRGTPIMYYGDEIGMHDVPVAPENIRDPFEKRVPNKGFGRDPERSPMRWDASPKAGFTTAEPWLPMGDDVASVNVASAQADPGSLLNLYHHLLALRREEPALNIGRFEAVDAPPTVLAYLREHHGRRLLVALNFGTTPVRFKYPDLQGASVLLGSHTHERPQADGWQQEGVLLPAFGGEIIALAG